MRRAYVRGRRGSRGAIPPHLTAYPQRILSDPQAFFAYYACQADAAVISGDVIIPTGYPH